MAAARGAASPTSGRPSSPGGISWASLAGSCGLKVAPPDDYEDVEQRIFQFLGDVGFTARHPTPQAEGVSISEEARREELRKLAKDMPGVDWPDQGACRD